MPVVNSLFPLPSTETPSEKNVGIPAGPLKSVFLMQPPMKQTQSQIKNPQSRAAGPAPPSLGEQAVSSRTLRAARPSFPALFTKINKSFLVFFFPDLKLAVTQSTQGCHSRLGKEEKCADFSPRPRA